VSLDKELMKQHLREPLGMKNTCFEWGADPKSVPEEANLCVKRRETLLFYLPSAACAAARRAIGTRNGLQLT